MRNVVIFSLSIIGVAAGLASAVIFALERKAQPPVFAPVSSPYPVAIYANGIIEGDQASGSNIAIYPEVSGPVTAVAVHEGDQVAAGAVLFTIDDVVQRASTAQLALQARAAGAILDGMKALPREESLAIAAAQVDFAEASAKVLGNQYEKRRLAYEIDALSISKDVLDTTHDAARQADSALAVARKQYELTKAGAWSYDLLSQEAQFSALEQAHQAAEALLLKHAVRAPVAGVLLAVNATIGSVASAQGIYNPYTQGFDPLVVMSGVQDRLAVRCYVDEILLSRLPAPDHIRAQMSIRGTDVKIPLEFVRVQPYVSPKLNLSNQRQEKVDLRVLPVIFRFRKQAAPVYPGQLVDVFIGDR